MKRLKPRFCKPLDEAIILCKDIVEIFDLSYINNPVRSGEFQDRVDSLQASQIGSLLVDDNPSGTSLVAMALLKNLFAAATCWRLDSMKSNK